MSINLPLIFFLLMVPLSGFIAWSGDHIGHKIGKKRHTLFGLRPRHTATLITVATGACVALVSFTLMWATSETFRTVLRDGTVLLQTNSDLKATNHLLSLRNAREAQEAAAMVREAQAAALKAKNYQQAQYKAEYRYRQAARAMANAENELKIAQKNLSTTRKGLDSARILLSEKTAKVEAARRDVARAVQRRDQAVAAAENARQNARRMAQESDRLYHAVVKDANNAIQIQSEHLREQKTQIDRQDIALRNQAAEAESRQAELTRLNEELVQLNTDLDKRRNEMEQLVSQSMTNMSALRRQPITFRIGEEVSRAAIPGSISIWKVRSALDKLLADASRKAEERGAVPATSGKAKRAVLILPRPVQVATTQSIPPDTISATHFVSEEESLRAASEAIRVANTEIVVVAVSAANTVAGEPVPIELRTYHNPIILKAGSNLGEITLNGKSSEQEILDTLYTFLHREVRRNLLAAGVIPLQNGLTEAPTGGSTADTTNIVTVSGNEWLNLIDKVRHAGPRVRVAVLAAKDLRAADPVSLAFDVTELPVIPNAKELIP